MLLLPDKFEMEINDVNLKQLAGYLQQTLNPDTSIRRPGNYKKCIHQHTLFNNEILKIAEKLLECIENQQHYPVLLLNLIDKQEIDMTIRIAGAIAFKNYIKRNWAAHEVRPIFPWLNV